MWIVADNDVIGAVELLWRVLRSADWAEYTSALDVHLANFDDLGLRRDATDREVWSACQAAEAVLITGNRTSGPESLDETIRQSSGPGSLPAITVADPQRLLRDGAYATASAVRLLDYLERLESLRGVGRLYLP